MAQCSKVFKLRVLTDIVLDYDIDELIRFCHLDRISDKIDNMQSIVVEGYKLLDPKAMYKTSRIEVKEDHIILEGGKILSSKLLAEKFKCASEVAVYIVTIGPDLEKRVAELGLRDLYRSFILDNIGTYALRQVFEQMKKDFEPNHSKRISKFSPGSSSSWDINQQKIIFDFIGKEKVRELVGVTLNEHYVMIPRKSVSGVIGDTINQFHECQICEKNCEYRKAPFSG